MYKEQKPLGTKISRTIDKDAIETFARNVEADTPYNFIVKYNEAHPDNMVEVPDVEPLLKEFEAKKDRVKLQLLKGETPEDLEIAKVFEEEYNLPTKEVVKE